MRKIFLLLGLLVCFSGFSQNPDYHRFGTRSKYYQPDTLSTTLRDALTPKLGTILYHKDTGISQWEQWDGSEWVEFGREYDVVPRDSLIIQSPDSFGTINYYWEGTEAQMNALILVDPDYFDNVLWFCTDCTEVVEVDWGNINGDIDNQADLIARLDLKLNASSYTAADVLSKLLTVDGTGSGLDANLLEGNSSGAFLRSNIESTKTNGNLIFLDGISLAFGTSTRSRIINAGGSTLWILNEGDLVIRDGSTPRFTFERTTGNLTSTGNITSSSLIKSGGTSTQILMADGTTKNLIDDDTFATATSTNIPSAESVKTYVDNSVASPAYLKYVALLTQTGTSAPTATVLENTLGGTVVWTRTATGAYDGTLSGAFIAGKTVTFISLAPVATNGDTVRAGRGSNNHVTVNTRQGDPNVSVDDGLTNTPIEIRVYP